jgi:hypothetical protein
LTLPFLLRSVEYPAAIQPVASSLENQGVTPARNLEAVALPGAAR